MSLWLHHLYRKFASAFRRKTAPGTLSRKTLDAKQWCDDCAEALTYMSQGSITLRQARADAIQQWLHERDKDPIYAARHAWDGISVKIDPSSTKPPY